LRYVAVRCGKLCSLWGGVFRIPAVRTVLQCVAVCCGVLRCVAVRCGMLRSQTRNFALCE